VIPALHSPGALGVVGGAALFFALAVITSRAARKTIM
jgi:hypothetical protein